MMINRMNASFGKLNKDSISFVQGLNIVSAPNESGKSTWCAFIRAMLYGVDSSERVRLGYLPDKQRYAPWSGAPMEGSMELTAAGRDITLSRTSSAKGAPMRGFSAVYTGTSVPVDWLDGGNAGEKLTGVTKEVFRRSAFVEQGAVAISGSPELEKRIASIVSTGEENGSYTEADETLRTWQRKRRYNRRGMLPELEVKIDTAERTIEELNGGSDTVATLEAELKSAREDCERLEAAVTESRKRQRREALDKLNHSRAEYKRCTDERDEAAEKLALCREATAKNCFNGSDPEQLRKSVQADVETIRQLDATAAGKRTVSRLPTLIAFVLALVAATFYITTQLTGLAVSAAVLALCAIFLFSRLMRARTSIKTAAERKAALLKKYPMRNTEEIVSAMEEYCVASAELAEAERRERDTRVAYEHAHTHQTVLEEAALSELDFVSGGTESAKLGRELNEARAKAEKLSEKLAGLNGRLAAVGDPLVLGSDLDCMEKLRDELESEYTAISLAISTLREADSEIQSRFSPELGKTAAEYMSLMTAGRYSGVHVNRDFSVLTRTGEDAVDRDSGYLSAGTADLMYLAVRLAVCKLALPQGEPCPLIIDDALSNLDDERYAAAIELLKEIAETRQVILFTCRREK